jgi:hypothetical protein
MTIGGEGHIRHAAKPKLRHRSQRKGSETPKRKNAHEYEPAHRRPFSHDTVRAACGVRDLERSAASKFR